MSSRRSPGFGGAGLTLTMLGISLAGSVAGVVRAVLMEGGGQWGLAFWTLPLLGPIAVMAVLAVWMSRKSPAAGWWGGIAAAFTAAFYNFVALHPEYNRDANIGMGIHIMLGWLFPLGPAFLVGMGLGLLVQGRRGLPPAPTALEDAQPLPPLRPWLWPLLPPALVSLAVSGQPFMQLWRVGQVDVAGLPGLLLGATFAFAGQLAVSLSPALIALLILRGRAARDGLLRPQLAAFWGLCLGLAVTLGLFGFGMRLLQDGPLALFLGLCALPPVLGYGVGWWVGSAQRHGQPGG